MQPSVVELRPYLEDGVIRWADTRWVAEGEVEVRFLPPQDPELAAFIAPHLPATVTHTVPASGIYEFGCGIEIHNYQGTET